MAAIFALKIRPTSTTTTAMQVQHAVKTSNLKLDYDHLNRKQMVCAESPAAIHCCKNQLLMIGNQTPGKDRRQMDLSRFERVS